MLPMRAHLNDVVRVTNQAESRFGYLRLDKNENLIKFPEEFVARLRQQVTSEFVSAYPEVGPLYEQLASRLGCKEKNLYLSSGSDQAIKAVFEVFVDPGDRVAILHPTYAMFYVYNRIFQGELIEIGYSEGLGLDAGDVLRVLVEKRPRLICIANPNSPTGTIISPEGIKEIITTAGQQGTVVLMDEAYYYYYPISAVELIKDNPYLVVTRSFSKAIGLAAARLGVAIGHEEMIDCLHRVRPMYETNAFALKFAEMVINEPSLIENNVRQTLEAKAYLEQELDKMEIKYLKSFANFVLIDAGSFDNSKKIVSQFHERKILIGGGFKPPLDRYIRTSIGGRKDMQRFLEVFKEVVV